MTVRLLAALCLATTVAFPAVRTAREAATDTRTPAESIGVVTEVFPAVAPGALSVPKEITAGLAADPERWLDKLAAALTRDTETDSQKVRAIHDWVVLNIDYDTAGLFSGDMGGQTLAEVVRTGRSACGGYANLFAELCRLAGVECVTVIGHGRGHGFGVFAPQNPRQPDHAWNAVRIGGRWRLVDATWDAGRMRNDLGYEQYYSTDYLFPDPAGFIHTHFPADPSWQLLDQPVTASEFRDLSYLTGEFFRLGMRLETKLRLVNETDTSFRVELLVPENVSAFCRLLTPKGDKTGPPLDGVRTGNTVTFSGVLPSAGDWVVGLFAKPGAPEGEYTAAALLGFRSPGR